jgi:hypothetical protein
MSTDTPSTEPTSWKKKYGPLILRVAVPLIAAAIGALAHWLGADPKTVEVEKIVEQLVEQPVLIGGPAEGPAFGWVEHADQIDANRDPQQTLQFAATPAGKAALGDDDALLYRAVRKVNNKGPPWYPNVNQESVGCCVGCGFKHGADVCQATAILAGASFEWKPASVEVIYAGSRVDVGGGRLRGDGSTGAWAAGYLRDKGGIAPMEKVGRYDLGTFSPARARQWGASGAPAEVKEVAKKHPVKSTSLVTSAADVKRAILQGYPVAVCSSVGFNNRDGSVGTRDADGFCRPNGTWPHCMCFIGWRSGSRPGALCLNSWGDSAHKGPVWPEDMPPAAFWIDASVVDQMVRQGDSFALADVAGFPARKPAADWFIAVPRAEPVRAPVGPFAQLPDREAMLSW